MSTEVGSAYVTLLPSAKGFASKMQSEIGPDVAKVGSSTGTSYSNEFSTTAKKGIGSRAAGIFKGIAKSAAIAGAVAGAALGKVLVDSVSAASDLSETLSKSTAIFGKKAMPELRAFAAQAAASMGQSKQQALDAASTFAIFGKAAGLTGKKLVGFSTNLTGLASDLASFGNATPQEAIDALGAALRGESEPIRRFGVMLDDATLKAEALAIGILKPVKDQAKIMQYRANVLSAQQKYNAALKEHGKDSIEAIKADASLGTAQAALTKATQGTIPTLTAQQKTLAAQSAIFKQTKDAQGDFARTQGGLANQQRIIAAQSANLKTIIGKQLLPVWLKAATIISTKVMPTLTRMARKHLPEIRDALSNMVGKVDVGAIFDKIRNAFKGDGMSGASTSLASIGDSFAKLGPAVKDLAAQLPGINDILSVTAEVFGFLADHTDLLGKAMPFLVAAFAAYKLAQLASNVATAASVPLKIAEVAVNRQLVKSNKELVASRKAATSATAAGSVATIASTTAQTGETAAKNTGILTTIRQRVATVASTIAQKAAAAASKAWAAAQWLINAAMSANPLGLVVIAIVALVAAIVIAWKKSEKFRAIVTGAFNAVKNAASKAFGWVKKNWPLLLAILTGPIGLAVLAIVKHWDKIKEGAQRLFEFIKSVPSRIAGLAGKFAEAGGKLIRALIDGLKGAGSFISDIAGNIWDAIRGMLNAAITQLNAALEFKIDPPGPGSVTINPPDIPQLARGGRATGATLTIIGEREPETVLPDSMLRGLLERTVAANSASSARSLSDADLVRLAQLIGAQTYLGARDGIAERNRNAQSRRRAG